jgi:hypothetical protein
MWDLGRVQILTRRSAEIMQLTRREGMSSDDDEHSRLVAAT